MSAEIMSALRSLGAPATALDVARALGWRYADRTECAAVAREMRRMCAVGEITASVDPKRGKLYSAPVKIQSRGRGRPPTAMIASLKELRQRGAMRARELPNASRMLDRGLIARRFDGWYEITSDGIAWLEARE